MQRNQLLDTRLNNERRFLERYFNGEKFPFRRKNGARFFERQVTTSTESVYRLRVYIGPNYPYELPEMVVCDSPQPMPDSPEWKGSHRTHTWPPKYGFLKICYFRPACWTEKNRVFEVFNKGEEWLEAYEEYLATGTWIDEILVEMEPSEEELAFEQFIRSVYTEMEQNQPELHDNKTCKRIAYICFPIIVGIIMLYNIVIKVYSFE